MLCQASVSVDQCLVSSQHDKKALAEVAYLPRISIDDSIATDNFFLFFN